MSDNSLDLNINIGANTQDFASQLQKAENLLGQFQAALKKSTNVGEINYLNTQINNLNTTIDALKGKMSSISKPSGDATNALTNLSRVAQDAPYGFIGIANNINPLLESFQRLSKESGGAGNALKAIVSGLTGPAGIGLAVGAVSSLIVAFGDDIAKWISKTTDAAEAQKLVVEGTIKAADSTAKAREEILKVQSVLDAAKNGFISESVAIAYFNDKVGDSIGKQNGLAAAQQALVDKTPKYLESVALKAKAELYYAEAAKYAAQKDIAGLKDQTDALDKLVVLSKLVEGFVKIGGGKSKAKTLIGAYSEEQNEAVDNVKKQFDTFNKVLTAEGDKAMESYFKGIKESGITDSELAKILKKEEDNVRKSNNTKLQILDERLKQELAVLEAENDATKKWVDNEIKRHDTALALWLKYGETVKAVTGVSKFRESIAEQEKQADKKEATPYNQRKISTSGTSVEREENRIKKFDKELEASKKTLEGYAEFISGTLTEGIMTMWDAMQAGDSPLQALGDYLGDVAKKFAFAIIQATIFNGVMMLLNALTGGAAGEFMGAISSTSKLLGMAEGGIVSRPTLAMVGEGGQSEAVMPLNKLGNMMNSTFAAGAMSGMGGGGNGQFVLKGNDLVLALQRSNYSLNLRRGNGI
jgi:hypothetical protein